MRHVSRYLSSAILCLLALLVMAAEPQFTVFPAARPTIALTCAGQGWVLIGGDADGDGKADLIAGGPDGVSLMLGKGDGHFKPCTQLDDGSTSSVFLSDFDGDGVADLLTMSFSSQNMRLLKGTGQGNFAPAVLTAMPAPNFTASAVGDINGDGLTDVVVASWQYAIVGGQVQQETLTAYFGSRSGLAKGPSIEVSDVSHYGLVNSLTMWRDPKGTLQLIAARPLWTDEFNLDKSGNFTFVASPKVSGPLYADFNRDGYLDAISAAFDYDANVAVTFGSANGWLAPATVSSMPGAFSTVADVNGDGYPDLVGVSEGTITISLNRGGTALDPPTTYFISYGAYRIVVADFTGDGIPDVVVDGDGPDKQLLLATIVGAGNGRIDAPIVYSFASVTQSTSLYDRRALLVFVADFDHDGYPDVGVVTQSCCISPVDTPELLIFMNRGRGILERRPGLIRPSNANNEFVAARAGDFDGDGNVDVAIQTGMSSTSVLFGAGDGEFIEVKPALPSAVLLGAADMFNEGTSDLLFTTYGLLEIAGFTRDRKLRPVVGWPISGVLGDVNGDGLIDLYSPSRSDSSDLIINGGRSIIHGAPIHDYPTDWGWIGIADLDSDGIPDLIKFTLDEFTFAERLSVQHGNGDGTFAYPSYSGHSIGGVFIDGGSAVFLDWDGDHRTDIITPRSILLNRGNLQFDRVGQLMNATLAGSADFDGDGQRDAVIVTSKGLSILLAHPTATGEAASSTSFDIQNPVGYVVTNTGIITPHVSSSSGVPTGTVVFRDNDRIVGSVELGSSTALPLRAGSHHVTADYSGDAIFARSSTEFLMDVPRRGVAVDLFFGRDLAAFPSTLTARIGLGTEMFEPSGTVTFRDVFSNTVLATAPAASFATVTRDFGASLHSIRAEYSGDDNYLPGMSLHYSYSPTTVPVSPHDSRLTVTPTRGGYDIEVQLLGAGGQQIPLNYDNTPSITITSSRGSTGYPLYRDVGRYITSVGAPAAVEVLTISARVNDELIGTVTIGPSTPRQRAVHK